MGRVYLCLGKNAEVPWYFERARVRVWNIEELCYFVRENAWLLDEGLIGKKLAVWVGEQCGLDGLARTLLAAGKEDAPVEAFVRALFSYTGYCSMQEAQQVEKILHINDHASETERARARGDYFLESGRYVSALQEYEDMIGSLKGMKPDFLAGIYHNRGVAQARLFRFEKAAVSFESAWRLHKNPESAKQYLAAKRFLMTQQEYVAFLAEHPEMYEQSLLLESQVEKCEAEWKDSDDSELVRRAMEAKRDGAGGICRSIVKKRLDELKEEYKNHAAE